MESCTASRVGSSGLGVDARYMHTPAIWHSQRASTADHAQTESKGEPPQSLSSMHLSRLVWQ
jgi:hypothetical protein